MLKLPVKFFRSAEDGNIDSFGLEAGGLYFAEDTKKLYYAMPDGSKELIRSHVHSNYEELDTIPKGSDLGDWLKRLESLETLVATLQNTVLTLDRDKQSKLTPGKYISIDTNFTISCEINRIGQDDIDSICN